MLVDKHYVYICENEDIYSILCKLNTSHSLMEIISQTYNNNDSIGNDHDNLSVGSKEVLWTQQMHYPSKLSDLHFTFSFI